MQLFLFVDNSQLIEFVFNKTRIAIDNDGKKFMNFHGLENDQCLCVESINSR